MSLLADLILAFSKSILQTILGLLGYDEDWEPRRRRTGRRPSIVGPLLCFTVSALVLAGLIWLACWLSG